MRGRAETALKRCGRQPSFQ